MPEIEAPKVATLEEIRARLQARLNPELDKLPTHTHEGLGTVRIGLLNDDGYSAVEAAEQLPAEALEWPEADQMAFVKKARFRAYVKHGVFTADGKRLEADLVEMLIKGPFGAQNRLLQDAIQKQNPPRATLVAEFQTAIATSRLTLVLYRILKEAGQLTSLRDYLLAADDSTEKKALAEDLNKWEDAMLVFEALMDAEEAAGHFGIGVYERAKESEKPVEDTQNKHG